MATGRVLQFDHVRGFGFVAADDGGEDIFLHASAFDGDPDELASGIRVEFKVMAGDRGRKAFAAHIVEEEPGSASQPILALPATKDLLVPVESDEEPMCNVLSPVEFGREITEMLINSAPDLTGQQILLIRQSMLNLAKTHGWSDG